MIRDRRKQRSFVDINIAPFTDVILVLLIIFMVAAPVIYQSDIKIKLPKVKSTTPSEEGGHQEKTIITITTEGVVYLNDKLVTQAELKKTLVSMRQKNSELNVYLRADQQTRFKDVVDILDLLTDLGVAKLDIMAVHAE